MASHPVRVISLSYWDQFNSISYQQTNDTYGVNFQFNVTYDAENFKAFLTKFTCEKEESMNVCDMHFVEKVYCIEMVRSAASFFAKINFIQIIHYPPDALVVRMFLLEWRNLESNLFFHSILLYPTDDPGSHVAIGTSLRMVSKKS